MLYHNCHPKYHFYCESEEPLSLADRRNIGAWIMKGMPKWEVPFMLGISLEEKPRDEEEEEGEGEEEKGEEVVANGKRKREKKKGNEGKQKKEQQKKRKRRKRRR